MKTEMTEFTSTDSGCTATWSVTLTTEEEAALWKAKYERYKKAYWRICKLSDWMRLLAFIEFIIIAYLLVR